LKDELLPSEFKGKMDNWMFGCDVCQDVCPWNRFSKVTKVERFKPALSLLDLTNNDWKNLQLETFDLLFQKSAVKRTKFEGLKRNIQFIQKEI
jgi:epoxyqueuosine reductase